MKKIVKSIKEYKNDNIYIQYRNGDVGADDPVRPMLHGNTMAKQNGITLVALVITIIVLLLLAVVSINIVQNSGLIEKAELAKEEHRASAIQEQIDLFKNEQEIAKQNNETEPSINELIDKLQEQKLITEEEKNTIMQTGKIKLGSKNIIFDKNKVIPDNYKRCEYLKSSRTQYIDTEFIPKKDTKLEIEVKFDGNFKCTGGVNIFGGRDLNSTFGLNFGQANSQKNDLFCWCETRKNGEIRSLKINDDIRTNRNKIIFQSEKITYGNLSAEMATKVSDNIDSLVIFGIKRDKEYQPFEAYDMYLYSCKLYNGENLERNLIPCLDSNNRPCMYDTVSGQTFYNQGTGEFIAGPTLT